MNICLLKSVTVEGKKMIECRILLLLLFKDERDTHA